MGKTYKDIKQFSAYERISVPRDTSICVVGDMHEHPEQFFKLKEHYKPSKNRWLVSVGDVYDKGYGIKAAESITDELIELQNKKIGYAVRGNHEIKVLKKFKKSDDKTPLQLKWWAKQPLVITFEFPSGSLVTVLHAGITPRMNDISLKGDIEVVYVRKVDENGKMIPLLWKTNDEGKQILVEAKEGGVSWHEVYDGRFGYIVAGHDPQKNGKPKFYNFSANIDTGVFETGILTGQVFTPEGKLGELIQADGVPFNPIIPV